MSSSHEKPSWFEACWPLFVILFGVIFAGLGVLYLAKTAGLLALYAIPTGGTNKNLSGRLNNRFNLGGGETLTLDTDYQKNSYLALPETTNSSTRLGFNRSVAGSNTGRSRRRCTIAKGWRVKS